MNSGNEHPVHDRIMAAIREGQVRMRPRWQFMLLSTLFVVGALIVFFALLYVASLGVFFLRDSGVLYAPSFGNRGWWILLHSLPWLLIALLALFVLVLEWLVRRYKFVYQKPLIASVIGIVVLVFAGGYLIAQTPLHHDLMLSARRGLLPPPLSFLYHAPLRVAPPEGVYRGRILVDRSGGFVMFDEGGAGTTSVILTSQTRLPYGANFAPGQRVLVVGNAASGTVRAFGVREIDSYQQ